MLAVRSHPRVPACLYLAIPQCAKCHGKRALSATKSLTLLRRITRLIRPPCC